MIPVKKDLPMEMDADDNPTFKGWMSRIDGLVWKFYGLSVYDLQDCCFRDWYNDRLRPIHAANEALKNAGCA